jgi:hypothetical protein
LTGLGRAEQARRFVIALKHFAQFGGLLARSIDPRQQALQLVIGDFQASALSHCMQIL